MALPHSGTPDGNAAAPAWMSGPIVDVRASLDITAPATGSTATQGRREFSAWLAVDLTTGDLFDDLVLAVYEAIANTVDHAYAHVSEPGPVRLLARRVDHAIHVTITDHGCWRGDDHVDSTRPFRGRGLTLIRSLVPDVHLERGPAGTTVHLRAPLPPPIARGLIRP